MTLLRIIAFLLGGLTVPTVSAQQLAGAVDARIDQWQPVLPGSWTVWTRKFGAGVDDALLGPSGQSQVSACPYSSLFILRSHAAVKLGKSGCQFHVYQLSTSDYHLAARCRTLSGKDHYETTTLAVSNEGRAFTSATTWSEPRGSVTVRMEGVWSTPCAKE